MEFTKSKQQQRCRHCNQTEDERNTCTCNISLSDVTLSDNYYLPYPKKWVYSQSVSFLWLLTRTGKTKQVNKQLFQGHLASKLNTVTCHQQTTSDRKLWSLQQKLKRPEASFVWGIFVTEKSFSEGHHKMVREWGSQEKSGTIHMCTFEHEHPPPSRLRKSNEHV